MNKEHLQSDNSKNETLVFIRKCAEQLGLGESTVESEIRRYNADFSAYDNKIYKLVETRIAHWINFLNNDWFSHRLSWPLRSAVEYDVIIDLGFSVPYSYSKPALVRRAKPHWIFVDKESSAVKFYDLLLEMESLGDLRKRDAVLQADVELASDRSRIIEIVKSLEPESLLIVASEIIEHLEHPQNIWELIQELLGLSKQAHAYITLPIGKIIPSHTMEFLADKDAAKYVAEYMDIKWERTFKPSTNVQVSPYLRQCYCALGNAI